MPPAGDAVSRMLWPGSIVADDGKMDVDGLAASTVTTSVEDAVSVGAAGAVVPVSVTLRQYVVVPAEPGAEYAGLVAPPIEVEHAAFEYHW